MENEKFDNDGLLRGKNKQNIRILPSSEINLRPDEGKNLIDQNKATENGEDRKFRKRLSPDAIRKQKRQIWFNVICVFFSNSLISCGRMSLLNAITSLVTDTELATTTMMVSSLVQYLVAVILISPVLQMLSLKTLTIIGQLLSVLFIATFFMPIWPMLMAGGSFCGAGLSLIMSCSYAYANVLGYWYHRISGGNLSLILVLMSSIVNGSVTGGFLWGNLVLYVILDRGSIEHSNSSDISTCGFAYCNENLGNLTSMAAPSAWQYNTLIIVLTSVAGVGFLIACLISNVSIDKVCNQTKRTMGFVRKFKEILYMAKDVRALLLAFISMFIGFQQSFVIADFTKIFISCSLGISRVGYIMIGYGTALAIMPCIHWLLVKVLGRAAVIGISYLLFMIMYLMLFLWPFSEFNARIFFGLAVVIGMADPLMFCVVTSMFALLFKKNVDSALALCNFWRSTGLIISYTCNYLLCIRVKFYIMISLCTASLIMYLILEFLIHRKYKKKKKELKELELRIIKQKEMKV